MIPAQRRDLLLRELRGMSVLSVKELCEILDVSHMTVRRDIMTLEEEGKVRSVPGGVELASQVRSEPSYQHKSRVDMAEKRAMAHAAAALVGEGQTVYLDAGTTLGQLVPLLWTVTGLTVITNDITTAASLTDHPDVTLYLVGGQIDLDNRSAVGDIAAATVAEFNIDVAFVSTSSWDLHRGSTTPSRAKVAVKRAAMTAASTSVLVAGADKYGAFGTFKVAPLTGFTSVITDDRLPDSSARAVRELGVPLEMVTPLRDADGDDGTDTETGSTASA
ncbi:DeoR/GlpR family DNA-binding transcription regulator [Nocardiopsis sp. MG754419]|uniref:DeoR/GlpR family DNA-binding transcription regulator n=1 Tax=Nocardiopsis sp. MG754419 TaxID=2259865 RepID=UPI001BA64876|nr:DeoR/GlpR family DNA-binding transcription regulator [Nocardiopsis sp. MG754419]MBR8742669.1 DeoR/GlpR transcriptional regulator [Nocardiopsis sp. MG754419]